MYSCSNGITTPIIPIFQQLSPIILLLILLHVLLKIEKVFARKNRGSEFSSYETELRKMTSHFELLT